MELTILGNNGPFPAAGGACSGYLLRSGAANILIDCGNGTLANLQKFIGIDKLDAIILTHLHADHISDMHVLKYAVEIKRKREQFDRLLNVYAPPQPEEEYRRLNTGDAFVLEPITADTALHIGGLKLGFMRMKHPYVDFAVAVESGGKKFVYSGDTSWNEDIITFAKGADLLMLDAGLRERDYAEGAAHLTAAQCGLIASEAGVKRLLLTHFWPEYDTGELISEAGAKFRSVEAARILRHYDI